MLFSVIPKRITFRRRISRCDCRILNRGNWIWFRKRFTKNARNQGTFA
jgi:hypothetical protein